MIGRLAGWKLYALAGVVGAIALAGVYQTGVNAERSRGEAAQLRVEIETLARDRRNAERALISAADKQAALEAENRQREEALDALRQTLAERPETDRCPAGAADLDLLYQR